MKVTIRRYPDAPVKPALCTPEPSGRVPDSFHCHCSGWVCPPRFSAGPTLPLLPSASPLLPPPNSWEGGRVWLLGFLVARDLVWKALSFSGLCFPRQS